MSQKCIAADTWSDKQLVTFQAGIPTAELQNTSYI